MIDRIISEIRTALDHELYLSALVFALTLPDTCGKAEYPDEEKNRNRYQEWCDRFVVNDRCDSPYCSDMPYLSKEIIYSLRNSLLHQSTPNITQTKIQESRCKVDSFDLVINKDNLVNSDLSTVSYGKNWNITWRGLEVDIIRLCRVICAAAEKYYESNKEKFGFIQYSIRDIDE